jgi:hypothetical protein
MNLDRITGFEWDGGNLRKNEKHGVTNAEVEEVFLNQPLLLLDDSRHSERERRFHALGQTDAGRRLHLTFTVRGTLLRPISARDMSRKERMVYGKASKEDSTVPE